MKKTKMNKTNPRKAFILEICKSYLKNKERIVELNRRLDDYEKLKSETKKRDRCIIEEYEDVAEKERNKLLGKVLFFESSVARMGGRTAAVFKQLYAENALWDSVEDENGKKLSPSSVALEKEKGIEMMIDFYDWSKQE